MNSYIQNAFFVLIIHPMKTHDVRAVALQHSLSLETLPKRDIKTHTDMNDGNTAANNTATPVDNTTENDTAGNNATGNANDENDNADNNAAGGDAPTEDMDVDPAVKSESLN
ncbi:hypothetical protein AJ79_00037 [Helicocarpus griseus UAMH5409]|uniref:Uncharacterized protein n=1 Tax=Helicocarpus griseus UAMH5409 TaxID=1447875 RepID=A0A2B7Y4G3_9EURO|nr:hypothetical protein AJ79_00037 [Helicocarpus griseus UAMH5409]